MRSRSLLPLRSRKSVKTCYVKVFVVVKTNGKKRWSHRKGRIINKIMASEIHADSLHNSIRYYIEHPEHFTIEKLEDWEITASQLLGKLRSILGEKKWFGQLTLKRYTNPAPNQEPLKKVNA